jgi:ATP-dependent Clp protease ATP-binding subunit ClpC
MEQAISYTVSAAIFAGLIWFYWRRIKQKPKTITKTPQEIGAALHLLGGKIDVFSRTTIHPRDYLGSPDFREASKMFSSSDVSLDLLRQYITTGNGYLSSAALDALSRRPDRQELFNPVIMHFYSLNLDAMYFALRYIWGLESRPPVGAPFVLAQDWWHSNAQLVESFREYLAERKKLGDTAEFGAYLDWSMSSAPAPIQNLLSKFDDPYVAPLRLELHRWSQRRLDEKFLTAFGRFWHQGPTEELLMETPAWQDSLRSAEEAVTRLPPRSVLITGGARTGKTSFLKVLGQRLSYRGWRVFEASAAELQADQFYIGMLEGRIRQTVAELDAGKSVAWFVMDIVQMSESGTHRGQSASILEQILPAVVAGRLVILAEASAEGANRLFQKHPSLRAQLEVLKLEPFDEAQLNQLAHWVADKLAESNDLSIDDATVTLALQLSNQYLGSGTLPGLVVDLLKRAFQHAKAAYESSVDQTTLLAALSQITGLPVTVLNDREKIDLAELRSFFSKRVIGQDGAVSTIVDRIAMLKAGLTDPTRPVGVFLFVGPTGTGKTELAKVLATYLFGSPDRMTRLDMSEFQSPYSTVKIIGEMGRTDSDSLIDRVRKQPFSVILLDEFEKAHPNVWDLFLQIFDDGRLSDAAGKAADFRHTIIILTSNLGATDHRSAGLGFIPSEDAYGEHQLMQAVSRAFRPEFVNRLDKIVVFKPLSRDLMREILHKELRHVLDRRGLRNREWVVEWEPSAVDFLLDKGFSPEMGARPLKRAIDQYLLAPLASTLVEHRFPEGDQFLFVRSNGRTIEVEFVDPDAEETTTEPQEEIHTPADASLPSMILQPQGLESEHAALAAHFAELNGKLRSAEWSDMESQALTQAASPDIWSDPNRHAVFARIALIDRIKQAMATAERLKRRLENYRKPAGQPSRELVARLALQLHLVGEAIIDAQTDAPIDAVIQIEPVLEGGGDPDTSAAWCAKLGAMYRQWSERRHMQFEELSAPKGMNGPALIHVSGFGAFRTLANETGLHISEDGDATGRVSARVKVAAGPPEEPRADQAYRTFHDLFGRGDESSAVVRRYRDNPAPLVRDAKGGWRTGRIDMVLNGDFDLIGALQ